MRSNVIWALLAVIGCLLIEIFFFRGFLLEPNAYMFPFGGDGYFITYNMNFHAQHGEGLQLNSMNYPFGEVIFMTDANGVLTTLVQQLRDWGLPTEHAAIGFMNVATYYLIPLCVLFLFLIFLTFIVAERNVSGPKLVLTMSRCKRPRKYAQQDRLC